MKVMSRIGLVLAIAVVLASVPAGASCGLADNRTFIGYSYYSGLAGGSTNALGSFWVVGSPANNNGSVPASSWMVTCSGGGCGGAADGDVYLAGDWGVAGVAGCPPLGSPKMAFQFSAPSVGGGAVYGGGCVSPDSASGNYIFGAATQIIGMQIIPKVNVTGSQRNGGGVSVTINIGAPSLPGGIVDESSCGLAPTGYKIYSQTLGRGAAAPTSRDRATWAAQPGASPTSLTLPCSGNQDIYLAYSVTLPDGQETFHVGANSTVVQCGSTSSDQPNDFKIIKKPIRKPTSAQ